MENSLMRCANQPAIKIKKAAQERTFFTNNINPKFCCRRRIRTSTKWLAIAQIEYWWSTPFLYERKYATFVPLSPPPRQEGMSANFITLQCVINTPY